MGFKNSKKQKRDISYVLTKGCASKNELEIILDNKTIQLPETEYYAWEFLRSNIDYENAYFDMCDFFHNLITIESFEYLSSELKNKNLIEIYDNKDDILNYINQDDKIISNAEFRYNNKTNIYLKHIDKDLKITPKEAIILNGIMEGKEGFVCEKSWREIKSLYLKEIIYFI